MLRASEICTSGLHFRRDEILYNFQGCNKCRLFRPSDSSADGSKYAEHFRKYSPREFGHRIVSFQLARLWLWARTPAYWRNRLFHISSRAVLLVLVLQRSGYIEWRKHVSSSSHLEVGCYTPAASNTHATRPYRTSYWPWTWTFFETS